MSLETSQISPNPQQHSTHTTRAAQIIWEFVPQ